VYIQIDLNTRMEIQARKYVHFSDIQLRETYGLQHLAPKTKNFPWAKACVQLKAGCGKTAHPV